MRMKAQSCLSLYTSLPGALQRNSHVIMYTFTALSRSHVSCACLPATNPATLRILQWIAARLNRSGLHTWNIWNSIHLTH
jgi:hypothetical protein